MENGTNRPTEDAFHAAGRRLDDLVREFEQLPFPAIRDQVFELLQAVDALHRLSLTRLVELLAAEEGGRRVEQIAADPIVRALLVLYDLVPAEPEPEPEPGTFFIPFEAIGRAPPRTVRRPVFTEVARLAEVPPGTMRGVEVEGLPILVTNVAGEVYAVRDRCPGGVAPLSLGSFAPPVVVCPWHNEAFDVRTGRRADGAAGPGLEVLPVSVQDGAILLAIETRTAPIAAPGPPR